MKVYIFTGPTLRAEEGLRELEATYLPPATQGDVYRVAREKPVAIGLIDGCFESVPAVCHKELLWALSQGVHVFGAASMGALRAAELAAFGMEGVGAVYEALQRGELTDDDEVAVAHAPAELGWRALSEAMVNIRATLAAAEAQRVVEPEVRARLERSAKALFYADRSWPRLLAQGAAEGVEGTALEALRQWLPGGRVDQKRGDALALLRALRQLLATGPAPRQVRFTFAHTDLWESIRLRVDEEPGVLSGERPRP